MQEEKRAGAVAGEEDATTDAGFFVGKSNDVVYLSELQG